MRTAGGVEGMNVARQDVHPKQQLPTVIPDGTFGELALRGERQLRTQDPRPAYRRHSNLNSRGLAATKSGPAAGYSQLTRALLRPSASGAVPSCPVLT